MNAKQNWPEKSVLIKQQYPATVELDWYEVFRQDPSILGRLINDIIKLDQSRSGKPGKRPSLEESKATEKLRRLQGEDYTDLKFSDAFKILSGTKSIRSLAALLDMDKTYVHRLLRGTIEPTPEIIVKVSEAFGKQPSYFLEYRIGYVLGMLQHKLMNVPEASVVFYEKLAGRNERK